MSDPSQDTRRAEQQAYFTQSHIDIAVLKVLVENEAKQRVHEQAATTQAIKALSQEVAAMNTILSEAKGGWRVIAAVAGVAGVAGSAISWFVAHMGFFRS
jgi:Mrp family chromosome partitioning ATPase